MDYQISNNGKTFRKIRLYLADDHEIFRTGLRTVLRFAGDLEITGESGNVPDLLALIDTAEPDIVLVGAQPNTSNLVDDIKGRFPEVKILALGTSDFEMSLDSAGKLNGYIKKESSSEFLRSAIKTISLGGSVWSPELLKSLLRFQANPKTVLLTPESSSTNLILTAREKQLLILLANGKTNKQISLELHLAQVTIKKALQTLYVKLNAANRTQAVMRASQLSLI